MVPLNQFGSFSGQKQIVPTLENAFFQHSYSNRNETILAKNALGAQQGRHPQVRLCITQRSSFQMSFDFPAIDFQCDDEGRKLFQGTLGITETPRTGSCHLYF